MTALIARQYIDGTKADTPNGVNVANFQQGLGNAWDCIQTLGVGVFVITAGVANLTQANAGLNLVDASAGNVTINLPAANAAVGAVFEFKRVDNSANTVTVNRSGGDTFDAGATALSLLGQYDARTVRSDGTSVYRARDGLANPAQERAKISANDSLYRNAIINGCLREDQRNSGAAQTIVAGAALAYCVDRFYAACTGANVTGQQVTAADGSKRYQFTGAAGVTGITFGHRIEAANVIEGGLAGQTCTLSQLLQNTMASPPTLNWAAYYANTADAFGTLAAPTRTLIASGTFTPGATESLFTTQIAIPAAAITGVEIVWSCGAQTSGNLSFGKLQLERGAVPASAVSFERVDVGLNKRRCLRYFYAPNGAYNISNYAAAAVSAYHSLAFPEPMRIAPAMAYSYSSLVNASGNVPRTVGVYGAESSISVTTAPGGYSGVINYNSFSAEL